MASYLKLLLFTSALLFFISISSINAQSTSSRPRALVLQVLKDASTRQYYNRFVQRTPYAVIDVVLDLGGRYMWVDCEQGYNSTTYHPLRCGSAKCRLSNANGCGQCFSPPRPGCNNNTCGVGPDNSVTNFGSYGELAEDVVALQSTDGSNPLTVVSIPRFIFACAPTLILNGLVKGAVGMAGFGRTRISLPAQFSAAFSFPRKFAMCLSGSTNDEDRGVMFFGNGPYFLLPNKEDLSKALTYTPLLFNPVSTAGSYPLGEPSAEYFIGVKSIKVNDKAISFNNALLTINKTDGYGGTKISTVNPFTVLHTNIYKPFTEAFLKEATAMKLTRVASVAPFGLCFSSKNIVGTRGGAAVPTISLVLQNERVVWRIFGANSMVEVNKDVLCLGFVDGGSNPKTSIVIGGHQLEDNLVEFDVARSRLGFTSSLLFRQTTCSNFNFTFANND